MNCFKCVTQWNIRDENWDWDERWSKIREFCLREDQEGGQSEPVDTSPEEEWVATLICTDSYG